MTSLLNRLLHKLLAHRRHLLWLLLLGVVTPWVIFLKASSEIEEGEGFYGDLQILRWAHARARPALDSLSLFFTSIGGPVPMTVFAGLFTGVLVWRRRYRYAWFFGLAVGGAAALNLLAKAMLGRPRPAFWVSLAPETSYSFPSGHAMGSAAGALAGVAAGRAFCAGRGLFAGVPGRALPQRRACGLDGGAGLGHGRVRADENFILE